MSVLLENLNPQQQEAVMSTDGPVLIIAGAGSGKTKALTHRIAYQIREKKINPWNILAVTFTNKAAEEMKERIAHLLQVQPPALKFMQSPDLPIMGTFHSICVRLLRKQIHNLGYENSFVIYDAADQKALCKNIFKQLQIDDRKFNPKSVLIKISDAKNQLIGPKEFKQYVNDVFTETVSKVYDAYQAELEKASALDFDDLLSVTVKLFEQFPQILEHYQKKFQYISVDEYQDTNHAQYKLVTMLAANHRNICVVGDDWQSIYSWRGANVQNILDFHKEYKDAKVIKLEQNYRSTQTILDCAHNVISKNQHRTDKKLWTENDAGEKVSIIQAEDERHEAGMILQEIAKTRDKAPLTTYKDFVILYRTNAQSRVMEEACMRHGIPYKIVGGIKFYERKEIKDVLAYLRVILNPADSVSLLRIINTPSRKIGAATIKAVQEYAFLEGISLFQALERSYEITALSAAKQKVLSAFVTLIKELQQSNREFAAAGVIKHVLTNAKYKDFLLEDGTQEGETRYENVQELISVASKYDGLEPGISLSTFLEEVSLISDLDTLSETDNTVTLMTLHAAKGLEFPYVFIAGLEEGIFPHSRTLFEAKELEEERRLMYVGVTRAQKQLYLFCAKRRLLYGEHKTNAASQFLSDLPEELVEKKGFEFTKTSAFQPIPVEDDGFYEEPAINEASNVRPHVSITPDDLGDGDRVMHDVFGEGVVMNITGGIVTVAFKAAKYGVKKLALSVAPLKKL